MSDVAARRGVGLRAVCAVALALASTVALAMAEPPTAFGPVAIDAPWSSIQGKFKYTELDPPVTAWDHYVHDCGYRAALIQAQGGELSVTADDFVITSLRFTTGLKPGSDLFAAADLAMSRYGRPQRATMRDALGRVTIDKDKVRYIVLQYGDPRPARISLAGAGLWQYQVSIESTQRRWHENKMLHCARERARAAAHAAPGSGSSQ